MRADVATIYALAPDFVFWQEIGEDRDHQAVRDVMGTGYQHVHDNLAVPISVSAAWEVTDFGYVQTHPGRKRTTPPRYLAWALVTHRATGQTLALVNTHYISGAWNDKPKLNKTWRQAMWSEHWQAHRDLVTRLAGKYPVLTGGDFNRANVRSLHPGMTWLTSGGIDKLGTVGLVAAGPVGRVKLNSDHDARIATITLEESA